MLRELRLGQNISDMVYNQQLFMCLVFRVKFVKMDYEDVPCISFVVLFYLIIPKKSSNDEW